MFRRFVPASPVPSYLGERWSDVLGISIYKGTPWNDIAWGLLGNDQLRMGAGNDTAYGGVGDDRVFGQDGNDVLYGGDDDDQVDGGAGSDSLFGGTGNDRLMGGEDADYFDGGAGLDFVTYSEGGTEGVTVNLITGTGSGGTAEGDVYVNIENVSGSTQNDVLIGDANANTLNGNDGDDTINGGAGDDKIGGGRNAGDGGFGDIMTGGLGNDTFVFNAGLSEANVVGDSTADERDVITDFIRGQDKIDISSMVANVLVFTGLSNDFQTEDAEEIVFNWPTIPVYGAATLVKVRDFYGEEIEFYVLGNQSLTLDDFII